MAFRTITLKDLIPQITPSSNRHADYILWLGAGASVSSGVPTASGIVLDLLRQKYIQQYHPSMRFEKAKKVSEKKLREWASTTFASFNPHDRNKSEYAQVMDNVLLTPDAREKYLRQLLEGVKPSDGYKHLGLLLSKGIFDTMVTTNFDYLVRQGADPFLSPPLIEVDSLGEFAHLSPNSPKPRLIRLYGDFRYDNTLNMANEYEKELLPRFEAVKQLLREYGLIVIGYSGRDPIIMRDFFDQLRNNSALLRKGLFWCHRKGSHLSPLAEAFLLMAPKDRTFLVEIESFDSVMRQFATAFGVDILSEKDLQEQLAVAWEIQSWLIDLMKNLFDDSPPSSQTQKYQQKSLERLTKLLGSHQAVLISCQGDSREKWDIAAMVNISVNLDMIDFNTGLLKQLIEGNEDYIKLSAGKLTADDHFCKAFANGYVIENFPVWQSNRLLGFVMFASKQSLIEQQMIPIKTLAQLLVMASVENGT